MAFWTRKPAGKNSSVERIEPPEQRREIAARFVLDDLYISPADGSLVGISHERQALVLGSIPSQVEVPFREVAAIEVLKNGVTLTQTNRGSQLVGAAVGAAAFGGLGALAGGLTGSSRSKERLNGLSLKVTTLQATEPVHKVTFLPEARGKGIESTSKEGKQALSALERMHALAAAALIQAERARPRESDPSSLDLLERLFKLRQGGALTEEEFVAEKAKIAERRTGIGETSAREPRDRESKLSTTICAWGPVIGIHLLQLFEEFWPEMKRADAATAALRLQKSSVAVITAATPGEASRLRANLLALGATLEPTTP